MKTSMLLKGYLVLFIGVLLAPFLPFFALLIPLFIAVGLHAEIAAILLSLLFDTFLLPDGIQVWNTLTMWTLFAIIIFAILRNTLTL